MYYIGIDPGKTGAIAVIDNDHTCAVTDMPTLGEHSLDALEICRILRIPSATRAFCVIEKAQPMPKQGVVSVAHYMTGYGILLACLQITGVPFTEVGASHWKRKMGLIGKAKDESRRMAMNLFPAAELHLKKHHGRAEALLLAAYGIRTP